MINFVDRFGSCHGLFWTYQKFMGRLVGVVLVHGRFGIDPV